MLSWMAITMMGLTGKIRFLCEDETRVGLKTISGRKITARGVKPVGKVQWKFQATYIYGVVEPKTGEHFFYEFTHLNSQCFQIFLELVSQHFADSILIIQLDNGRFHKAKKLKIPDNIILMFQPPHCPESNPIEQIWQYLKRATLNPDKLGQPSITQVICGTNELSQKGCPSLSSFLPGGLRWFLPSNLDELRLLIAERLEQMNEKIIASIVGRSDILEALSVVGI